MAIEWKDAFGSLVQSMGAEWPPSSAKLKQETLKLVETWLKEDSKEMGAVLALIIADGKLDKGDAILLVNSLIGSWSDKSPLGVDFTKRLLTTLQDGELSLNEIASAVAGWIASRSGNKNVTQFLSTIANGKFSSKEMKTLLLNLVEKSAGKNAQKAIEGLIDGQVLLSEVLLLVTAVRLGAQPQSPGTTVEDFSAILTRYLKEPSSKLLDGAIEQLVKKDWSALSVIVLGGILNPDGFASLVRTDVMDRLRNRLMDKLKDVLAKSVKGLEDTQVEALATAIVDLLRGKRSLWAGQTELEGFEEQFPAAMYDTWVRVRKVLYAAQWALSSDTLVPTEALARPHVFAAAGVQLDTKLSDLAGGKNALFARCIKQFCAAEFAHDPNGQHFTFPNVNYPVTEDHIVAGRTAKKALNGVWSILHT